ncbi:MAG: DUF4375 domain-containing protein [Ruminococcaceae bacterium]|nr:DUF4375 domain-containing protein [Oscillospiraceae bacterium]
MGLFDFFKNKKTETGLTDEQLRWNKIWDLWAEGKAKSPYSELMTYDGEVNNGGHDQYFFNTENNGDLEKEISVLKQILPEKFKNNLNKAYKAYLVLEEDEDSEEAEDILNECDSFFYKNEETITDILKTYASEI